MCLFNYSVVSDSLNLWTWPAEPNCPGFDQNTGSGTHAPGISDPGIEYVSTSLEADFFTIEGKASSTTLAYYRAQQVMSAFFVLWTACQAPAASACFGRQIDSDPFFLSQRK